MQKLKRRKWNILKNVRIWKIKNPIVDKMNLSIEALTEEELEEYFTSPQSPNCNDDGRLESNRENQYSHRKILRNGRLDVIEDIEEQFNECIYLNAQE
jgi:hypothetical protein